MRAVVCTDQKLSVTEVDAPKAGPGQLVLDVERCGICGSDLHSRVHADALADVAAEIGYDGLMRTSDRIVLGHEFSGVVAERGKGSRIAEGTAVVSFPLLRAGGAVHTTGLSPHAPGAYAEKVLVQDALSFAIPNGLPTDLAALTEPTAVGLHAVNRGEVGKGQVAIRADTALDKAWTAIGARPAILEGFVAFEKEVSVIAARGWDGAIAVYDVPENRHADHILRESIVPARRSSGNGSI